MTETDDVPRPVSYSRAAESFREEVRAFLAEKGPDDLRGIAPRRDPEPELKDRMRRWADTMTEARLMCITWPVEYGGRGLSGVEVAIMNEEFGRANLPRLTRGMGESLVGPAVIAHASEEQKKRVLPPIISGDHVYCQGFSEPGAGSDLASLRTRGVVDGPEIVINGQKVWTSNFFEANMIFVLCRTDPDAPKHKGISYVLVPIEVDGRPNGIEFRPIVRMNGKAHFAETFFTDTRAPLANVIGGLNNGWATAMTTLGSERGGSSTTQHVAFQRDFWDLVDLVRKRGRDDDQGVREQLAWAFQNIEVIRYTGLNLIAELADGRTATTTGNGSAAKIRWSEFQRRFAEICLDLQGPKSLVVEGDYGLDRWQEQFLVTRSHTIWGGTAEIQRNIIGERVLGLPKEPQATKETGR